MGKASVIFQTASGMIEIKLSLILRMQYFPNAYYD